MCPDVFVCWLSSLTLGLQKGDLGEVMQLVESSSAWYPFQVLAQALPCTTPAVPFLRCSQVWARAHCYTYLARVHLSRT